MESALRSRVRGEGTTWAERLRPSDRLEPGAVSFVARGVGDRKPSPALAGTLSRGERL